jgi:hypothetical protein
MDAPDDGEKQARRPAAPSGAKRPVNGRGERLSAT